MRYFIFSLLLLACASCTPSVPYEIKSPCVGAEPLDNSYGIHPCVRRPLNDSSYGIS